MIETAFLRIQPEPLIYFPVFLCVASASLCLCGSSVFPAFWILKTRQELHLTQENQQVNEDS
jgi:hypothetical protein